MQTAHTHCASVYQAAKLVAALLRVAGVTAGLAESNGSLPSGFMTHITCRLTAKNRDQLRNLALGNRVWATFFTFLIILTGTSGLPFTRADLLPAVPHKEEKVKAMTEDAEPIRSKIVASRDTTAVCFHAEHASSSE